MTRSGSYDWSLTRVQLVNSALRTVLSQSSAIPFDSAELADATEALNMMLKAWSNKGFGLWARKEITLHLEYGEEQYSLGPTGDHATATAVKTEIETAADSGDSSIEVDSIAGISDGDYIGIELDDGTLQWTTVDGDPSGTTVTLDDSLTDDAAVDNHVYAYTTKCQRPLKILEIRRVDSAANEVPMELISRTDYMALASKTSTSYPNQAYYDPQLDDGVLYIWPACSDVQDRIKFTAKYLFQDMDSSSDDFDFPPQWLEAIKYNLCLRLAPEHGKPLEMFADAARVTLEDAMAADIEDIGIRFQPDNRWGR